MNLRRRFAAGRSFSIEKLEPRSMLAADAGECIVAAESVGLFVGEESPNLPTSNCWLQPDLWVCALPAVEFIPTDDSVTDEAVSSVTDPDSGEPVTDPADGDGLAEGSSVTVEPIPCVFEPTGMIAVDPTVIMDPVVEVDHAVGVGLLIEHSGIDEGWTLVETGWDDTGWAVDPSTDPVRSDEQAVEVDDAATVDKVVIEPWFRRLGDGGDPVVCIYDEPVFWCAASTAFVAEQVADEEFPAEAVDTPSPSGSQVPAVVLSSGAAASSTVTSAAIAQAFAGFAVSFGQTAGQGGSDVQPALPFVGGRRAARR